jgi:hypothetical protein
MRMRRGAVAAAGVLSLAGLVPVERVGAQSGSAIFPRAEAVVAVGADRDPVAGDFDGDGRGDLIFYTGNPDADGI